ncbi:ATP-binding cassette domain-containing protein [Streptomyces mutabilis]|uniref:ATP-binding cassette domain-containing protein n=1 Tax=Streptomyces mutabilis TaxID=67332 RepID=UPI0034E039B3
MTTRTSAIEVAGLCKSYGDQEVVAGVDLTVPTGTVYALLGPNGAGKTTTVRILSTSLPADAGEVRIAGYDVRREADRVRASIGVTGRLRALGVDERIVRVERDGWIPLAARSPERVPEWMARKLQQLADPQIVDFYVTLGEALDRPDDDPRLVELADKLAAYITQVADEQGEWYVDDTGIESPFAELRDTHVFDTLPSARRLVELLSERGWTGWTKLERVNPPRGPAGSSSDRP